MESRHEDPGRTPEQRTPAASEVSAEPVSLPAHWSPAQGLAAGAAMNPTVMRSLQAAGNNAVQRAARMAPPPAAPITPAASGRLPFKITLAREDSRTPHEHGAGAELAAAGVPEPGKEPAQAPGGAPTQAEAAAPGGAPAQAEAAAPGAQPPAAAPADPGAAQPATPAAAGADGEAKEYTLPDVEVPTLAGAARCDIAAVVAYDGSISEGGPAAPGFGKTYSFESKLTDIKVKELASVFIVTGTLVHEIKWNVAKSIEFMQDVSGPEDPAITSNNWPTAVKDLTPDMGKEGGRPPRSYFWARDLTVRHEQFHAADDRKNAPAALYRVLQKINAQKVSGPVGLSAAIATIPIRFAQELMAAMSTEEGEERAYGDGASAYKARADAIDKKGKAGEYRPPA